MKKVIHSFFTIVVMVLVSCATTTPTKATPEPPVAPPIVKPDETPLPPWTSERLLQEGGVTYLVVSGSAEASWKELLTRAHEEAVGKVPPKFLEEHPRPPKPDFARGPLAWWKVILPPQPPEPPVELDPIKVAEEMADAALNAGKILTAMDAYVDAVVLARTSGRSDATTRSASLLDKAVSTLGKLQVQPLPGDFRTTTGTPFGQPFQVRVTLAGEGVAGVPLRFSAKLKKNGRLTVTGQTLLTDASGTASYSFPTPDFSASDEVVVVLDVNTWLEKLVHLPKELQDKLSGLESVSAARRVAISYTIASLSKGVPMSLAYADYDEKGGLLRRGDTLGALSAQLAKSGYTTSNYTMNLSLLKSRDDATVLLAWLSQGKKTGRAVFGSATVTEVSTVDKKVTATVTGTLKVYDLETRKLVHQQKAGKAATGNDRASAITAALQQLAADFVTVLNDELP